MISIDLGVIRSKVTVTRADSFSTVSGLKLKGFFDPGLMILHMYNVYGPQMISIDLGVIRSKVKVTRADSFSTISGL